MIRFVIAFAFALLVPRAAIAQEIGGSDIGGSINVEGNGGGGVGSSIGGVANGWTPTWIPSTFVKAWYRSDTGITVVTGVSQWNDTSSNAWNATQATGAKQPAYTSSDANFGGQASLSFAAASTQTLANTSVSIAQPFTAYVVARWASFSNTAGRNLFDGLITRVAPGANTTSGATTQVISYAGSVLSSAATALSTGTTYALGFVFNGASSAIYQISSTVPVASGTTGANTLASLVIGGNTTLGGYDDGSMSEMLFVSGTDVFTRGHVFSYFANRYKGGWQ